LRAAPNPSQLALDGPDAAGKRTLANELALSLRRGRRAVIRATVDDFERPRRERYRAAAARPTANEDAFDYAALRSCPLKPLGPGGSRRDCTRAFDLAADRAVDRRVGRPERRSVARDGSAAAELSRRYIPAQRRYLRGGSAVRSRGHLGAKS
jgi:hypothetical protein